LVFIGIHCDKWPEAQKTAKQHKISYPITNAIGGKSPKAYKIDGYPTVFVLDKKGVIRSVDPDNLEAEVKKLLKQKPSLR
jgi:peroxiredoxin